MGRGARLAIAATLLATCAARAQEGRDAGSQRLMVETRRGAGGAVAEVRVRAPDVLGDGLFDGALKDGFPIRFQYRLELYRDGPILDRMEGAATWEAVVRLDPLTDIYQLARAGGSVASFTERASLVRALQVPYAVDLLPERRDRNDRYYYVAVLEVISLSLSELEEVERWLRGDFGPAITERGDVGNALSRGARRLLIRFSGLPRRRLEARSETFRP